MTDRRMRRSGASLRYRAGRLLVFGGALAAAWSVGTLLSGGFALRLGPLALSSRDPVRPLMVALGLLAAAWLLVPGGEFRGAIRELTGDRERRPARIAGAAAIAVLIVSVAWNSHVVGGSDSSCYVLQAEAFARGHLTLAEPLSWIVPDATPAMFAPAGFVASKLAPFAPVPICAPGLALIMAGVSFAWRDAVFLVVPVFAAAAIWVTFVVGRRLDDAVTGATAAVLLATSPIFLYQSVQPMSDVPAATLWLASVAFLAGRGDARRREIAAGICASAAVLIRPNVALIVLPLLLLLGGRVDPADAPRSRIGAWLRFGLAAVPCLAALAWLNAARYGSPLTSGYGTDSLFSTAHVGLNLARYPRWLLETETPFLLAAALAPWWAWRRGRSDVRLVLVLVSAVVLTVATYLAYTVFDDWWYLRFLLPALPVLLILSVAVCLEPARRHPQWRTGAAIVLAAALGAWHVHVARTRLVFDLQAMESRFAVAGRYVGRALPANAVVFAAQESGSLRYYGGRVMMAWDAIPAGALDRTIAALRRSGRPVFMVLEDEEVPRFRARFRAERLGGLDWPPHAEVHGPVRVTVYDAAARDRYLAGGAVATEQVR
ncbi:MAG TPA: glycosyltransferase family 39 protein [Vicinamibacterales bacterium]|nr:glycosyltransferase family 39 protein [Vicinamibacterales bacterium]